MGEPLMYKHFPQIVELCKKHNVKLNLTTNGTFLWRGVTEWGNMIVPVASDVKISWNGTTPEVQDKVMVGSKYDQKLQNLKEFIRIRDEYYKNTGQRCTVTLQLTFMEMNVHELPDVVKLGISLGVDRIKGHHLWAHFDEIKNQGMRRNPDSIARWNLLVRECTEISNKMLLPPLLHDLNQKPRKIRLENIFELKDSAVDEIHPQAVCPFLGKEAWVNFEGRFDPCCAPNSERLTLGAFGNVLENGLLKIWKRYYSFLHLFYYEGGPCEAEILLKFPFFIEKLYGNKHFPTHEKPRRRH